MKGIWRSPPLDWPRDIEFVDPNNGSTDSGSTKPRKPKKELLVRMMEHLVMKYQVNAAFDSVCVITLWHIITLQCNSSICYDDCSTAHC